MNWDAIGAVAEAFGALAVILTLVYLASQVRDSSRSNRASAIATLLCQYDSPNGLVAGSTVNARVFRLGFEGSDELDADEKVQFEIMTTQYMTVFHTAFRFHVDGILPDEYWSVFRRDLVEFTDYPGLQAMRDYWLAYYSPDSEFAGELEKIYDERFTGASHARFLEARN